MTQVRAAWVLAIALGTGACVAVDPAPWRAAEHPIVGGSVAQPGAVVELAIGGTCSGTLVAPDLVLTARHCVADVSPASYTCTETGDVVGDPGAGLFAPVRDPGTIEIADYGDVPLAPRGKQILVSSEPSRCKTDVALLVLDRTIDDPVIAPLRLDAPPAPGESLGAAGWGETADAGARLPQEREVTVEAIGPVPAGGGAPSLPVNFFAAGEALCHGDSGGPALAASGAVTGVASYINNPDVETPTGTAADCLGPDVRSVYESTQAEKGLILQGFAAVGATAWREGQPDPRASLAEFGEPCADDAACKSAACLAGPGGVSRCTHGCLGGVPCPQGYACTTAGSHQRCTRSPADMTSAVPSAPMSGGCAVADSRPPSAWALLVVLLLWGELMRERRSGPRRSADTRARGWAGRSFGCRVAIGGWLGQGYSGWRPFCLSGPP